MKEALNAEIERKILELETMEVGTDEYKAAVDSISKLVETVNGLEKSESESVMKAEQAKADRKDRKAHLFIDIAGVVLPLAVTVWGTIVSIRFEETGTITTIMGRGFINKLLRK